MRILINGEYRDMTPEEEQEYNALYENAEPIEEAQAENKE